MPTYTKLLEKKTLAIAAMVTVAIAVSVYAYVTSKQNGPQTLAVSAGDFVQTVSVSGKVVAAEQVDLAFNQTGRISAVYANVGSGVAAGTVLASIENGDLRADVLDKEAALDAAEAVLQRLLQGSRPEEIAVSEAKVNSALVALSDANKALEEKINDAYVKSDDAVRTQSDQFFSSARSQNPQLAFQTEQTLETRLEQGRLQMETVLNEWTALLASGNGLREQGIRSREFIQKVQKFLEDAALALSNASAYSSVSATTISGWASDISSARTALSTASVNLSAAVGTVEAKEAALTLAERELALEKAGETRESIDEQRAKVKSAEANLMSAKAKLAQTLITAPFSGIVSKMDAKVGSIVSSNTSLISMLSADAFQIESYVPEINMPLIRILNTADATLDAYGERVVFRAEIISIDPAETIRDGVSTYKTLFRFLEKDDRIRSGMTANVVITTVQKSDVIAVPQGVVGTSGLKRFVMVKEGQGFVEREVTIGDVSSLGTVEILTGLNEGDVVSLEIPQN